MPFPLPNNALNSALLMLEGSGVMPSSGRIVVSPIVGFTTLPPVIGGATLLGVIILMRSWTSYILVLPVLRSAVLATFVVVSIFFAICAMGVASSAKFNGVSTTTCSLPMTSKPKASRSRSVSFWFLRRRARASVVSNSSLSPFFVPGAGMMLPTPAIKSSTVNSRPNFVSTSSIRDVIFVNCAGFKPVAISNLNGASSSLKSLLRNASKLAPSFSRRLFKRVTKSSIVDSAPMLVVTS